MYDLSKESLKNKVHKAVEALAHKELLGKARNHSKVRDDIYPNLKGMEYMKDPRFTPDVVNLLFKFRTRMFNVRNNFRNNYKNCCTLCPLCKEEEDSQEHLFCCRALNPHLLTSTHEDIYSNNADLLLNVGLELKKLVERREKMIHDAELPSDPPDQQ